MSNDFLPSRDTLLSAWATNFSTLITATPGAYGLMASDAATLSAAVSSFTAALTLVLNPATKTKATVADKNGKKHAMCVTLRQYARMIKNNLGVSNQAKIALGLRVNDAIHTPVPAPTTEPLLTIFPGAPLQQAVRYADPTAPDKRGKPAGVASMLLAVAVGDEPPEDPAKLPTYALVTHQNYLVSFTPADKAKTAYYYARWVTRSGLMGPWSAVAQQLVA